MSLCKCGCGQEIIIKPHHKYCGIPRYINGHSRRKPKSEPKLCECGCGSYANPGKRFIHGHYIKINNPHPQKPKPEPKLCECGCGGYAKPGRRFIFHHHCRNIKRPDVSERRKQQVGEKNHMFGRVEDKNPNWNGGTSKLPYHFDFNEELKELIRKRDHHTCQLCKEYGKNVHHIDYDKMNCNPLNLITLCNSDNSKVNFNREEYERCFKIMMTMNYGSEVSM